jgi:glycosyltransferase involved in cell wall biosynthesis
VGDPEAPQTNYADMSKEAFERLYLEARLKVILPVNLRSFLADNARNPLRLARIAFTQFGGVLIKTFRSAARLRSIKSGKTAAKTRVLFVSYNGLLEPILPSQAVPYMKELCGKGYEFILFTYEKKKDLARAGRGGIEKMKKDLAAHGIEWIYRVYHKNPPILSTIFDLAAGIFSMAGIVRGKRVKIIHVRGITPGMMVMALANIFRVKILFDMRGLLAEEYVGGGLWTENSAQFKLVKNAERRMLKRADAVTVLTKKHLELNKSLDFLRTRDMPMDVIPCCVDMKKFDYRANEGDGLRKTLGLDGKFILMYPGKIGTFYLVDEMLHFYKAMSEKVPDSVFVVLTNDDPSALLKKAKAGGIVEDKLKVIKAVPFEEMPKYLSIADAGIFFINPYKKIGSSPIKMGEFLASGVPVIINPGVGDTEELVREGRVGVIVEKFSTTDYSSAIERLFELKNEGEGLRTRCRDVAGRNLSLKEAVGRYARIYESLVGAGSDKV